MFIDQFQCPTLIGSYQLGKNETLNYFIGPESPDTPHKLILKSLWLISL